MKHRGQVMQQVTILDIHAGLLDIGGSLRWGQVVHMDIKPANILLQDRTCKVAKIADLGVSRYLVEGSLSTITSRGAPTSLQLCQCMVARR